VPKVVEPELGGETLDRGSCVAYGSSGRGSVSAGMGTTRWGAIPGSAAVGEDGFGVVSD
jgi:hypothetical protein